MKKIIYIVVIIVLILIGITIYYSEKQSTITFNKVDLTEMSNVVYNYSSTPYLDTVTYIGLDRLGIRNVHVMVFDIKKHIVPKVLYDHIVNGFIIQSNDTLYQIFVRPNLNRFKYITIMSHELIHIQQLYCGRLVVDEVNVAFWDGRKYVIDDVHYFDRPWEVHAYREEVRVSRELRNILF